MSTAGWRNDSCTEKSNSILDAYQCENAIIDFGNSGGGEGGENGVSRDLNCEGKTCYNHRTCYN